MGLTDQTFFISYSLKDITFAHEIEQILKNAGCRTIRQKKDSNNATFISTVHEALSSNARVIAIYSDDYFNDAACVEEAYAVLAADSFNENERLLPMLVKDSSPVGLLGIVPFLDLVTILENKEMEDLKEVVLAAVEPGAIRNLSGPMPQLWQEAGGIMHPEISPLQYFTARERELSEIKSLLSANSVAAVTAADGIGKSSLARQFAWNNRDYYGGIWWINADTQENIINSLLQLGEYVKPGISAVADREHAAHMVLQELSKTNTGLPWLLIYDNLENPNILGELTPDSNAHILITSRRQDFQGYTEKVDLDIFTEDEAVQFLIRRTGDEHQADAGHLAQLLGYFPLALELAAAYCKSHYGYEAYTKQCRKLINNAPQFPDGYPIGLWAAFSLAFDGVMEGDVLKDMRPCPHAEKLFGPLAYFAPEDVPADIFPESFMAYPRRIEAIHYLQGASLLKITPLVNGETGLSMHSLVQDMAQDRMDATEQSEMCVERATSFAVNAFPGNDGSSAEIKYWPQCMRMENHVRTVLAYAPDTGEAAQQTSFLLNQYGIYLYSRCDYSSAEPVIKWTLSIDEENFGKDHPNVSSHLNNLAQLYKDTDRLDEAEPLMKRAMSIDEENFGADNLVLATHLNNLGQLYIRTARYDEAEVLMKQALTVFEKNNSDTQPYYASALNNLAKLYLDTDRLQEAGSLLNRAQKHAEQFFSTSDPRLEGIRDNLSALKNKKTALLVNEMEQQTSSQVNAVPEVAREFVSAETSHSVEKVISEPTSSNAEIVSHHQTEVAYGQSNSDPITGSDDEKKENKGIFSRLFRSK